MAVRVLEKVVERYPNLTYEEVESSWDARLKTQIRMHDEMPYIVSIGVSSRGQLVEIIAFDDGGDTVIFHAMTPPPRNLLAELGMN